MDIGELATVGARIAELGLQLKEKRAEAQAIQTEISALEKELTPLVSKHAQIIAEIVGTPPAPPSPPPGPVHRTPQGPFYNGGPTQTTPGNDLNDIRRRVMAYVDTVEPDENGKMPGAQQIADVLKLDPVLVRQAMLQGRR